MGKHKNKHRQQQPGKWALKWREAEAFGCILPDYVPDCPDCGTDRHVSTNPRPQTGIFECRKCQGNIVVLAHTGDETSILLQELEEEGDGTDGQPAAGLGVYAPMDLVEEFADAR